MHFYNCLLPAGSTVKNLLAMQVMQVQSLGGENSLQKEMETHSNIPAMDRGAYLVGYSPWGHKRVRNDLPTKQHFYDYEFV